MLPSGHPLVTSLGYDNQSRTLACTSTGGPATTVTWSRNGIVITLKQDKRIVDSFASTYQTVLTIDLSVCQGDIVGTYSCTVENARGRSSVTRVIAGNGKLIPYMHYPLALLVTTVNYSLTSNYTVIIFEWILK